MRKLWCAGAVVSGMLFFGAAPAWADPASEEGSPGAKPAADVVRTAPGGAPGVAGRSRSGTLGVLPVRGVPVAGQDVRVANLPVDGIFGRLSGLGPAGTSGAPGGIGLAGSSKAAKTTRVPAPDERPVSTRLERAVSPQLEQMRSFDDHGLLGGLGGGLPVLSQVVDYQSDVSGPPSGFYGMRSGYYGLPFGGSPVRLSRSAEGTPDDGTVVDPAPKSAASVSPSVSAPAGTDPATDPATEPSVSPATDPTTGLATDAPAPAGSTSASPAASAPVTGTDAPAPAMSASVSAPVSAPASASASAPASAGEQVPGDPAVDDPRLAEEPVDGFVNRAK